MAKVQFNCRLTQETIDAINKCAARYGQVFGRKVSQSEVLERALDGQMLPATVHTAEAQPTKKTFSPLLKPSRA